MSSRYALLLALLRVSSLRLDPGSGSRHLKNYLQHVNSIFIVLYLRCFETEAVTKNKSQNKTKKSKERENDKNEITQLRYKVLFGENEGPLEMGQSVKLEFIVERLICVRFFVPQIT